MASRTRLCHAILQGVLLLSLSSVAAAAACYGWPLGGCTSMLQYTCESGSAPQQHARADLVYCFDVRASACVSTARLASHCEHDMHNHHASWKKCALRRLRMPQQQPARVCDAPALRNVRCTLEEACCTSECRKCTVLNGGGGSRVAVEPAANATSNGKAQQQGPYAQAISNADEGPHKAAHRQANTTAMLIRDDAHFVVMLIAALKAYWHTYSNSNEKADARAHRQAHSKTDYSPADQKANFSANGHTNRQAQQ
ncbi:hypothetical protein JKP88DRAFT_252151 [Tribonema minus]|uniref:Uncharacterized protein n=1 Tax=Tribonema minus TaxID=303371 RepID=A0A836CLB6_9STRA|nr:hypothetical protein JKP88DRAFT_252151 [Tribonema minus]